MTASSRHTNYNSNQGTHSTHYWRKLMRPWNS